MKTKITLLAIALIGSTSLYSATKEIELHTEKVGDAVHWMPEKVEVSPGDKVTFIVKHDLEGGFDFHGFTIPSLGIAKQVDRHKPMKVEATIPATTKAGEYPIGCQFHPKHVGAKLIVK